MQHILVVDDEPANATMLRSLLQDEGFEVTIRQSGHVLLEVPEDDCYDLIVISGILLEMSGLVLCRLLRDSARRANHHCVAARRGQGSDRWPSGWR